MSDFLASKNKLSVARWWLRWREGGGSFSWAARPLKDLRNDEDLRRYRLIELKRRHTPHGRKVVNLTARRFERERQKVIRTRLASAF